MVPGKKEKGRYFRGRIGGALFSIPAYFIAFILGYVVIRPAFLNQEGSRVIGFWCLLCGLFSIVSMRRACKKAKKAGRLERSFECQISEEIYTRLMQEIQADE